MYDIITCHEQLQLPDKFKSLSSDWRFEPFKTNCLRRKFEKYIIYNKQLFKEVNGLYEKINYNGFLSFYTHFFDEDPHTVQYHLSYLAEFDKGNLNYILLNDFKEYDIEKENINANFFMTVFNLFKKYLK